MDQEKISLIEHLRELRNIERLRTCGLQAAERYKNNHMYRFNRTIQICKKLAPDLKPASWISAHPGLPSF